MRVIYDVGANNGDDIPYYLLKADKVVAIEANPLLCDEMRSRFTEAIRCNRLAIENVVATDSAAAAHIDFYVHKTAHVLSQIAPPPAEVSANFSVQRLPARPISDIVAQHGDPYYIKIDIEGHDSRLLRALFAANIRPPYISAEIHDIDVFGILLERGGYRSFKLVDGQSVSLTYANRAIHNEATGASTRYSFPYHSAGPFGNDVDGPWLNPEKLMRLLAFEGLGWKDVHATLQHPSEDAATLDIFALLDRHASFFSLFRYLLRRGCRSVKIRMCAFWPKPPQPRRCG